MKKKIFTLKRQALILIMLCSGLTLIAQQVEITVNTRDAQTGTGSFSNFEQALITAGYNTSELLAGITDLKITTVGTYSYNSREFAIALEFNDFDFINKNLPDLSKLDLSDAVVTNNYGIGRGPSNGLPNNSFKNNTNIKSIVLPSTLIGVGTGAFMSSGLEGVINLPQNIGDIDQISQSRFGNSKGITGFIISDDAPNLKTIDGVVFDKSATILTYYPAGRTDESYSIPEGVTTIRNSAFECNDNLKNLTFASTTTTMQAGVNRFDAIANHSLIENIYVAEGNTELASVNGVLYQKATNRVVWSPKGKTKLIITAPVQIFAGGGSQNSAFGGNGNSDFGDGNGSISNNYTKVITYLDLPETLEEIENGAFVAASNLATIICRATTVPKNNQLSFNAVGGTLSPAWSTKVYVPASALEDYKTSSWVDKTIVEGNEFKGFNINNFFGFYNINLTNATALSSIASDIALEGDNITATVGEAPVEGHVFDKWTSATHPELLVGRETSNTISFTMPATDVELTAVFKEDSSTNIDGTENSDSKLAIYPNPATDYIQLIGSNNSSYTIYTITGQLVSTGITNGEHIVVSSLANGVYVFKVEGKAIRFIKK